MSLLSSEVKTPVEVLNVFLWRAWLLACRIRELWGFLVLQTSTFCKVCGLPLWFLLKAGFTSDRIWQLSVDLGFLLPSQSCLSRPVFHCVTAVSGPLGRSWISGLIFCLSKKWHGSFIMEKSERVRSGSWGGITWWEEEWVGKKLAIASKGKLMR